MGANGGDEVNWPRSPRTAEVTALAPRLESLDGRTVAFLWDDLFRGDEIFPVIERELAARHAGMRFVSSEALGSTHGAEEHAVLDALAARLTELGVDAVVSGVGC